MNERKIQRDYVMEFISRREEDGGLGYRTVSPNIVSNELIIPSVLGEFVRTNEPEAWERLLRKHDGDERQLETALKEAVYRRMLTYANVAVFLNKNKTITFEDEVIPLFHLSGSELMEDREFEKNIFCAVEESEHRFVLNGEKVSTTVRPDITFFVNGIYFGYMELKTVSMGQNAEEHGRRKVTKDYLCAIQSICQKEKEGKKYTDTERRELLALFHKAIHLTASDCNQTFVMRNVAQFEDMAFANFREDVPKGMDILQTEINRVFKDYPVSSPLLTGKAAFEEVVRALYGKRMVEKEIRYFNFLEYKYKKLENGKKVRISNSGKLICPRPKQKFGCDKIMGRIKEMLDHEQEPDYYMNQLRQDMLRVGVPQEKLEEIIRKRQQFYNNKFVYSLLMQYAAGFGKSNIIGWTALQLKDYRHEGCFAYDKVLMVVDRVQLRDQLDTTMMNMNIDNSMFVEANDSDTFVKALSDKRRIIVVNIQKFLDLQNAINKAGTTLKKMRVAFLIDEIHRSNSGENNKVMIDIFSRLQETFNAGGKKLQKKNLLIGFTATPSEETLTRFGEYRCVLDPPLWQPFDHYSMQEAIADGYILDPTEHIFPYAVPVDFVLPPELKDKDLDDEVIIRENKAKVYAFEPRIRKIAEFVVERLLNLVYLKIKGEGKAMLAVSSIPNAITYLNIIKKIYAEKCGQPQYAKYADAPIAIVYSDSQGQPACATFNDGLSEEKVIGNFRQKKNGLIIVVDKLQTGFDEPKLHTLFLDKEIRDINAIQTISRVNRTCKYKTECHVIDCSWRNVNQANIKTAFRKFCGMTCSRFNPEQEAKEVAKMYKDLLASKPYVDWFGRFQREWEDSNFVLDMENRMRQWVKECFKNEEIAIRHNEENELKPTDPGYMPEVNPARTVRRIFGSYHNTIQSLRDIYVIAPKYYDKPFLDFWLIYCRIYRDAVRKPGDEVYEYVVEDSDELPGFTLVEDNGEDDGGKGGGRRGGNDKPERPKTISIARILEIIKQLNLQEALSAQAAQLWLKEVGLMFQQLNQNGDLCATITDSNFADEEKMEAYKTEQNKYVRTHLKPEKRPDLLQLDRFKQMLKDNMEHLYAIFVSSLSGEEHQAADFDYDTTKTANGTAAPTPQNLDDILAMVRDMYRPKYDRQALKQAIVEQFTDRFADVAHSMRSMEETVDNLFMVLDLPTVEVLDGMGLVVKDALNMVLRSSAMGTMEKRMCLDQLLIKYESFLKKLFLLCNDRELKGRTPDMSPTLTDAIFAIPSLKCLKRSTNPALQEFDTKLTLLRQMRNDEAHGALNVSEQDIDTALQIVVDMYLYAVGTNITELEMAGHYPETNVEDKEPETPLIPISKTYQEVEQDILRAAEAEAHGFSKDNPKQE